MRTSCNGCRVLRKGCGEDCNIKPCLQWIESPESQAHATLFLSKFYGRVGLSNLINASPQHLRPELFRSLLYEACGRIVNPINGSVGLLWSGSWQLCHAAVEAVLKGAPIMPITFEPTTNMWSPPPNIYDIRHVSKDESSIVPIEGEGVKTRSKLKQVISSVIKPKATKRNHSVCHESSSSHRFESESAVSAEASINIHDELDSNSKLSDHQARENGNEVGLELKLGFESTSRVDCSMPMKKRKIDMKNWLC